MRPPLARLADSIVLLKWLIYGGSSLCLVEGVTYGLMAYAGERVTFGQFDPIQAPVPRRPWLSCVGESGSRCEDELAVERRGLEAGQDP